MTVPLSDATLRELREWLEQKESKCATKVQWERDHQWADPKQPKTLADWRRWRNLLSLLTEVEQARQRAREPEHPAKKVKAVTADKLLLSCGHRLNAGPWEWKVGDVLTCPTCVRKERNP